MGSGSALALASILLLLALDFVVGPVNGLLLLECGQTQLVYWGTFVNIFVNGQRGERGGACRGRRILLALIAFKVI